MNTTDYKWEATFGWCSAKDSRINLMNPCSKVYQCVHLRWQWEVHHIQCFHTKSNGFSIAIWDWDRDRWDSISGQPIMTQSVAWIFPGISGGDGSSWNTIQFTLCVCKSSFLLVQISVINLCICYTVNNQLKRCTDVMFHLTFLNELLMPGST